MKSPRGDLSSFIYHFGTMSYSMQNMGDLSTWGTKGRQREGMNGVREGDEGRDGERGVGGRGVDGTGMEKGMSVAGFRYINVII